MSDWIDVSKHDEWCPWHCESCANSRGHEGAQDIVFCRHCGCYCCCYEVRGARAEEREKALAPVTELLQRQIIVHEAVIKPTHGDVPVLIEVQRVLDAVAAARGGGEQA